MALIYMGLAKKDLSKAVRFIVSTGHIDPISDVTEMRDQIVKNYSIKNPGVKGLKAGTMEWVLRGKPYLAIIKWVGDDCKLYRILPTALIKTPKR